MNNHFLSIKEVDKSIEPNELSKSETKSDRLETRIDNFENVEQSSAQELAENIHLETKNDMLSEYGKYMNVEHKEVLESENTKEKIHVLSTEEYINAFPEVPFGVVGHCDHEGNIYIKELSDYEIQHISTHETMHLCSATETRREGTIETYKSGIREVTYRNGEFVMNQSESINEGLTEMYTLREMELKNEIEGINSITAYSESRVWAERMEKLIGRDITAEAYFGGNKEQLRNEFNRLNKDDMAWEYFSRDVDIVEKSSYPQEILDAKKRLAMQYKTMAFNKYGIDIER